MTGKYTPLYKRVADRRVERIDTSDLWIVPYADFMTILMIFFLMMFAFAYVSKTEKKYGRIITDIQKEMGGKVNTDLIERMMEKEQTDQAVLKFGEIVEKQQLSKYVTINSDKSQIKIVFNNPVLFDIGQAELKPESITILHEIGVILKVLHNEVVVEGHTDNIPLSGGGKYKSNWELSNARALAVVKYFIDSAQLPPELFATAGYGEFRPVYPNDSEEHRNLNRRIEINIIRGSSKVSAAQEEQVKGQINEATRNKSGVEVH